MIFRKPILISLITLSFASFLIIESCKHDPDILATPDPDPDPDPNPQVCDTTNITYSSIVPILSTNCYGCHNDQTANGGINLTKFETVTFLARNGILQGVIKHEQGFTSMPPNGKLNDCNLLIINKWVNDTTFENPGGGNDHPCDPDSVYFENDIFPLIISTCATTDCHGTVNPQDDIVFKDYASIIENGKIKPGNPEGSKLFKVINEDEPQDRMPPESNEPLSPEQISKIRKWIEQGALNNSCDEGCDTTNVTFSQNVWPVIENKCFGCHSGNDPGGSIYLRNYTDVAAVVNNGKLWGAVNHEDGFTAMPKNLPKLPECELVAIRIWIEEGARDN